MLDLPTVPVIRQLTAPQHKADFENEILTIVKGTGSFDAHDAATGAPATMEGVVTRNAAGFPVSAFAENVFKYVRKGHVKTDVHWTRNWRRAALKYEGGNYVDHHR